MNPLNRLTCAKCGQLQLVSVQKAAVAGRPWLCFDCWGEELGGLKVEPWDSEPFMELYASQISRKQYRNTKYPKIKQLNLFSGIKNWIKRIT